MPSSELVIRPLTEFDAESVSLLLPDLGYEATPAVIQERFRNILTGTEDYLFVAESSGEILGYCHSKSIRRLESDGYGEILTLVVKRGHQRQGIGQQLVRHATEWIFKTGFSRVRLGSGVHRVEAHLFYESLGFTKSKPGCNFELRKI